MPRNRAAGFTLIEVLVAMVVTTLLLVLVMNGAVSARERGAKDRVRARAAMLARSLLEDAASRPFQPGQRSGDQATLHWSLAETAAATDPRHQLVLSEARVTVTDRENAGLYSASLRTLKSLGS